MADIMRRQARRRLGSGIVTNRNRTSLVRNMHCLVRIDETYTICAIHAAEDHKMIVIELDVKSSIAQDLVHQKGAM